MDILIWHNKYGPAVYDASTPAKLEESSRLILEWLVKNDWIVEPTLYKNWDEELAGMEQDLYLKSPKTVQELVDAEREKRAQREAWHAADVKEWEVINRLIAGSEKELTAWDILSARDGNEYETYEITNLLNS